MLAATDRLRLLCKVLDLSPRGLSDRLVAERNLSGDAANRLPEQVSKWWRHDRQPVKHIQPLVRVLADAAIERKLNLPVHELWAHKDITPGEFAAACGLDLIELLNDLSPACQRTIQEQLDQFPFLTAARSRHSSQPEVWQTLSKDLPGTYFIYRIHSTERCLCREVLTVHPQSTSFSCNAIYYQYAAGGSARSIDLSVFVVDERLHAIGAYEEVSSFGRPRACFLHAVIWSDAYKERFFTGLLLDASDNDKSVVSQKAVLVRVAKRALSNEPKIGPRLLASEHYNSLFDYLQRSDQEDASQITANPASLGRFL